MENYKQKLRKITTFIFDIDGVFTDGTVWLTPDGEQIRTANIKDGYAVQLAVKKGFRIAVITGGSAEAVKMRFHKLGVNDVYLGVADKWTLYQQYLADHNLKKEEVLYMGDDIVDLKPLGHCGVAACPADAVNEVRTACDYASHFGGGKGCVRDVVEQTLKVQGKWLDKDSEQW